MANADKFWGDDLAVLLKADFIPKDGMTEDEKLNAVSRLIIVAGVLLMFKKPCYGLATIALGLSFVIVYRMRYLKREGFPGLGDVGATALSLANGQPCPHVHSHAEVTPLKAAAPGCAAGQGYEWQPVASYSPQRYMQKGVAGIGQQYLQTPYTDHTQVHIHEDSLQPGHVETPSQAPLVGGKTSYSNLYYPNSDPREQAMTEAEARMWYVPPNTQGVVGGSVSKPCGWGMDVMGGVPKPYQYLNSPPYSGCQDFSYATGGSSWNAPLPKGYGTQIPRVFAPELPQFVSRSNMDILNGTPNTYDQAVGNSNWRTTSSGKFMNAKSAFQDQLVNGYRAQMVQYHSAIAPPVQL